MYKSILHTHNRDKATGSYVEQRMSHGRDDRTSQSKQMLDAELRGKLGSHRANQIIATLDNLKSRR